MAKIHLMFQTILNMKFIQQNFTGADVTIGFI